MSFIFTGGMAVQKPLPEWYVPADPFDMRPKTFFTVSNSVSDVELEAVLLSDSGASGGLTLPARKIIALQLTPVPSESGGRRLMKTAGNTTAAKIQFQPGVVLRVKFTRLDGEEDSKACFVHPWCHEEEYLSVVNASVLPCTSPPTKKQRAESTHSQSTPQRVSSSSSSSSVSKVIAKTSLSPIGHRSESYPSDRASIGMEILQKLGAHINCCSEGHAVLEIEEESFIYED